MPYVYVPQQPSKFDAATKLWIPTMNLDPAKRWGELVIMLPPNANRLHTAPLVKVLKAAMSDFCEDDYIVAVGDPSIIAAAACIAFKATQEQSVSGEMRGLVKMLKWDRLVADYIVAEIDV